MPISNNGRDWGEHTREHEHDQAEHDRDHEREREIAKDTAQRLEREVEQTAQRLERSVEETAVRIEKAVATALTAVSNTAQVHADAHQKEHVAHERIHAVEGEQVKEARSTAREQALVLSQSLDRYKAEANEWRGSLRDQETKYLRKEEAGVVFAGIERIMESNSRAITELRETVITQFSSMSGKSEGLSQTAKVVVASAGFIATMLGIIAAIIAFTSGGG